MSAINLYSSRVHPRRIFPTGSWIEGLSDYNKVGGSYLWGRGVDYRTEPSQVTLLPASVLEVGQSTILGLPKWGEQVVGRTVTLGNSTNLISNGSFEVNTTGWTLGADYSRSSTKAYLGSFSIKQLSTTGSATLTTASGSGVPVATYTDYQLVFYTNVVIASGSPAHLQVLGGSLSGANLLVSDTVLNDTGGNWTQVIVTFNSGNNTSIFLKILNNGGSLTAYYDNFTLVQINSLATFVNDNVGNVYKRYSNATWVSLFTMPSSHGNGMAYYGEDDFLYVAGDKTIGRYGPISAGTPTFVADFLGAAGGVPTNTNSLSLVAASSMYSVKTSPASAVKITGDIAIEAFIKPSSLPAVGSSMTIAGLWTETGNQRAWKFDILGISGVFGDGSDSSLTVSSNTTDAPIDSQCSGVISTNQLSANNGSFAVGQKILIIQMQGTGIGTYQRTTIQGYDSTNHIITTQESLNFSYSSTGSNRAQVLVMKQYANVTVNSSCTWSAKAWNGTVGGILAFHCNGTLTNNGTISAAACGFRGGDGSSSGSRQGFQGEGSPGTGAQTNAANGTGGGGGIPDTQSNDGGGGGGGGSHATAGGNGTSKNNGGGGTGATTVTGSADLTSMTFGGAGGEGGADDGGSVGRGGNGGGIVLGIVATLANNSIVTANGEDGQRPSSSQSGGDAAGAGGSVLLKGQTLTNSGTITALGGTGIQIGNQGASSTGGNGGDGRIHFDYLSAYTLGTVTPTLNVAQDNTLVTSTSYQLRLGISNDGTAFEYLTQNLKSLAVASWDRVQVSWDSTNSLASFYESGVLIGTAHGSKTAIFGSSTSDLAVGANKVSAYQNFFDGLINDVRVWTGQRTSAQFAANNTINLNGIASGLVGNWYLTNTGNDLTTNADNLVGTNSPTFSTDVPYPGATTRLDIDQTSGVTGQTYTLPTALTENQSKTFVPGQDPQKSLQVNIGAKGTGDWTLVVHNGLNQVVAQVTVPVANLPASGVYEFVYPATFSPVVGATYHFHLYSTVNDGTIVTGAASDITTAQFTTYYQFLVNDTEYHPMLPMVNVLGVGNGRYLATQDAAGVYNARRLKFPAGWRVRALAKWRGFYAIGCWKGTGIKDFDQGIVFLWDGFSVTYNDFFDVPEGGVNAMYGENGTLYISAGYKGDLLEYTGADSAVKVKRLPRIGKSNYIEVAPGGMTYWQGLLRIAYSYNSDSDTMERGVYTWGSLNKTYPKSLSYDYPISTGNRLSTVSIGALIPVGGDLLVGWQDGTAHGIDNINVSNPVQATGTLEELITDYSIYWKEKEVLTIRADHLPLKTGENIDVKYKTNYESNWHNVGISSQAVGDTFTRYPLPTPNAKYHALQIAVDLYAANGTSPTILEHSQDTDLLFTNTDEVAA